MLTQPLFILYYIYYDYYTIPLNNFIPKYYDPHNSIKKILKVHSGSTSPLF